jgi:hypothetical protein
MSRTIPSVRILQTLVTDCNRAQHARVAQPVVLL